MFNKWLSLFVCFSLNLLSFAIQAAPTSPSIPNGDEGDNISANPAAVNIVTGTGQVQTYLEKKLGIKDNRGIFIGGAWIADVDNLFSGGVPNAKQWTTNSLFLLNLIIQHFLT